ncbi:MAG: uracil-DNA glycosylase family protein [Candidatus Anstonellales archaeon]
MKGGFQMSDFYNNLKMITNAVLTGNCSHIPDNISEDEFKRIYVKRLYTLLTTTPRACKYINTYMNDFNVINIGDIRDFVYTLNILINKYGIKKGDLFFGSMKKYNDDMLNMISIYGYRESRYLKELMDNGLIKTNDDSKADTREIKPFISSLDIRNSEKINELCKHIAEKSRIRCEKCPMFGKSERVILETNLDEAGPVDFAFIGINPGKEEALMNRPFIGRSGKLMRSYLDKILDKHRDMSYLITNVILCSTDNESKIPNVKKVISLCKSNLDDILKYFKPKYMVLFGDIVVSAILPNLKGRITSLNSRVIDNKIISVHPSMVIRNPNNKHYLENVFNVIDNLLISGYENLDSEKSIGDNWILFDIRRMGNKILMIFTDENGKKRYVTEDIKIKSFLRSGSYKDCDIITDNIDRELELDYGDYIELSKRLRYNMRRQVENVDPNRHF